MEELLSQNMDILKTLHGEITYLTTGEYPIVHLNDRPMPTFKLRKKLSIEPLTSGPMEKYKFFLIFKISFKDKI